MKGWDMHTDRIKTSEANGRSSAMLYSIAGLLFFALTIGGCAAATAQGGLSEFSGAITKGPVLLRVYRDRAALMWETDVEGAGEVLFGRGEKLDRKVESRPRQVEYGPGPKRVFIHKVWLDALEAGQGYRYKVCGQGYESNVFLFFTVPSKTDRVRFIVYGDSRSEPEAHRKLVKHMMAKNVDFIVHTGDLVSSGDNYKQWGPQFFEPVKGLAEYVPFYIAKGNHEGEKGNFEKLLVPEGSTNEFVFDYGPVHYFGIDNSDYRKDVERKIGRIVADAQAADATWKFVSFHTPSLNFGGHWSAWGAPDALPAFGRAGVDFIVSGHSHQYERFKPVAPLVSGEGNHVTYITAGGGGAPLRSIKRTRHHASVASAHHFCLFNIDGGSLKMDTIDIKGRTIDHLEISKRGGKLNEEYLKTAVSMAAVTLYQEANRDRAN